MSEVQGILGRHASPMVVALYTLLVRRTITDQRHVLGAIQDRRSYQPRHDGRDRSREALSAYLSCTRESGRVSRTGYTKWRARQPKADHRPDARTIIAAFGSWDAAIAEVSGDGALDIRAARLLAPIPFSKEEILLDVLDFANETEGPLRVKQYISSRRERMDKHGIRGPRTSDPIKRLGGWVAVLTELGIADRAGSAHHYWTALTRRFSDEDCLASLRDADGELAGHVTVGTYKSWRQRRINAGTTDIPSAELIQYRFGSWNKAKVAAGLSIARPDQAPQSTYPYSDAEMAAALRDCTVYCGAAPSQYQYRRWRAAQIEALPRTTPEAAPVRIPSDHTIKSTFGDGTWASVRARIQEASCE